MRAKQRRVKLPLAYEFAKSPLEYDDETDAKEPVYSAFNSVMFVRSIAYPWARHISQKTGEHYVYNLITKQSEYEFLNKINNRPSEAEASFIETFQKRVVWNWPHDSHGTLNMDVLAQLLNSPKRT